MLKMINQPGGQFAYGIQSDSLKTIHPTRSPCTVLLNSGNGEHFTKLTGGSRAPHQTSAYLHGQ